tara:strand:- start:729 stop:1769 length:1041 start_codon:yes stop_codon:yes gene_type:complete
MSRLNTLIVGAVERLTSQSVVISFDVNNDLSPSYAYLPGQYISLELEINGNKVRRSYSICSSPISGLLQVGIKEVPNGIFSTYVNRKIKKGDEIKAGIPEGRFTFDSKNNSIPIMAVAAGSGITPIMSILRSFLDLTPNIPFTLIYGNKTLEKTMFYDELKSLEDRFEALKIYWCFSEEKIGGAGFGRIDSAFLNYVLKNSSNSYPKLLYLCGPEKLIDYSKQFFLEKGFNENDILFELFTSSIQISKQKDNIEEGLLNIKCDDVTHKLTLDQNKTLLEIALDEKIDVPYSCQGGVCSSCIARVTEGKVDMKNNQILTEEEIQEGLILSCIATPKSNKITIDFDDV